MVSHRLRPQLISLVEDRLVFPEVPRGRCQFIISSVSRLLHLSLDKGFGLSSRKVSKVDSWILIQQLQRHTLDVIHHVYLG